MNPDYVFRMSQPLLNTYISILSYKNIQRIKRLLFSKKLTYCFYLA